MEGPGVQLHSGWRAKKLYENYFLKSIKYEIQIEIKNSKYKYSGRPGVQLHSWLRAIKAQRATAACRTAAAAFHKWQKVKQNGKHGIKIKI